MNIRKRMRVKTYHKFFVLLGCALLFFNLKNAIASERQWGVGLLAAWPLGGITGYYNINNAFTLQLGVDPISSSRGVFFRGLYRFYNQTQYSAYGFGTLGLWSRKFERITPGFALGAGLEFFFEEIIEGNFPTISLAPEIGAGLVNFDAENKVGLYPYLGLGIYYRF
jgi:hypothetical protein